MTMNVRPSTDQRHSRPAPAPKSDDLSVSLWRAVILQAITDATSDAVRFDTRKNRDDARAWLTRNSRDFQEVCALADIEPDQLRTLALQKIADCRDPEPTQARASKPAQARKPSTYKPIAKTYTHDGKTLTVKQWAQELNVTASTLRSRLFAGKPIEGVFTANLERLRARTRPSPLSRPCIAPTVRHTIDGLTLSKSEWMIRNGIKRTVLQHRLKRGWSLERALSTPTRAWRKGAGRVECLDEELAGPLSRVADDVKELEFQ